MIEIIANFYNLYNIPIEVILPEIIRGLPSLFDTSCFQRQKAATEIYDLRQEPMISGRNRMICFSLRVLQWSCSPAGEGGMWVAGGSERTASA